VGNLQIPQFETWEVRDQYPLPTLFVGRFVGWDSIILNLEDV